MQSYFFYETRIGTLKIVEKDQKIIEVALSSKDAHDKTERSRNWSIENKKDANEYRETKLIQTARLQVEEYLSGRRKTFDFPIALEGTDFQKRVWNVLLSIPFGETRSYSWVADQIQNPKAVRAVGMANHKNPLLIVIPCHRVIGIQGNLTGYAGGLSLKEELLYLERNEVRQQLYLLAEESYQKFSQSLLPGVPNMLGVRLPHLRKMAKNIMKQDWRLYLLQGSELYFEEIMLKGIIIGYAKTDIEEVLSQVTAFVPSIHCWSVCDSFCSGLKITKKYPELVWDYLKPYFFSKEEYSVRFAVVMTIFYYIKKEYLTQIFSLFDVIEHDGYYVKMAVAWSVSICFISFPEETTEYLLTCQLEDTTYQKALQKITESHKVDKDIKEKIKAMKRK